MRAAWANKYKSEMYHFPSKYHGIRYAINATPEQALRSDRAILLARVNAALGIKRKLMYPDEGEVGKFKLLMYRGIKDKSLHLHEKFASDPGDYGCGEYWTDDKEFAANYGEVVSKLIELDNVYRIPRQDVLPLIEEYETCKIHLGRERRLEGSQRLTNMFREKGYDAVLTVGYESFDILGLCIFNA